MQAGSQRGIAYHQVRLAADGDVPTSEVLSDGEARCVGLAGFFTELGTAPHRSGIVFDDPVSSLDHRWRNRVAARLVEEARSRQVIVFTHDLVFLAMLKEHADALDVRLAERHLTRGFQHVGLCRNGPPWYGMTVKQKLGELKDKHQRADKVYRNEGENAYTPLGREIYGLLRETWERAVEEVLLCGAVMRFQRAIKTQSLGRFLATVTPGDYAVIEAGMDKCSRHLAGHDQAPEINEPVPGPDELLNDIEALENWVKEVRKR